MAEGEAKNILVQLPENYQFLKVLGEGGFGKVLQCLKKDTQDIVAVKIPKGANPINLSWELKVLEFLTGHMMNEFNILATAINALSAMNLVHSDIKPDNIMVVDHQIRPIRIKLIDFGLTLPKHKIRQGMRAQTLHFRSPEILLGLPFSEAIDVWALGCIMAHMILSFPPFPGFDEYETIRFMVALLGPPSDLLLNKAQELKSSLYFRKTLGGWHLKTPLQFYKPSVTSQKYRRYPVPSLDHINYVPLVKDFNEKDQDQMIELLKGMLQMDQADRITASLILKHPFISAVAPTFCDEASKSAAAQPSKDQDQTRSNQEQHSAATASLETDRGTESNTGSKTHVTSVDEACNSEDCKAESEGATSDPPASVKEDGTTKIKPDQHTPTPKMPCVIMVRPAAPENTVTLEFESKVEDSPDVKEDNIMDVEGDHHRPSTPRSRRLVIMVHPAALENTATLESESKAEDLPDVKEENTVDIEGDHHRPSTPRPRRPVIMVHPAAPENIVGLGSQESNTTRDKSVYDLFTATTSKTQQQQPQEKKKKNCFQRFCSWVRKNMCSCWSGVDDEEESQR
ncbi:dual specificity tyrosine-phosphorylation-regulated kinase 4-like [Scomber japonicus]|uniref:dual specificity tyrosine-phosphorylation-regulated kinase 4-like n=1 Tax=Scomber japonicus TaxID=13676 RepID=UPI002305089A|nr:dual specificity tyrosine-phosphorylation-regulated kinase 4-like [Scomber japonicus]